MRQLPTMYALCDVVEALILEGCKDQKERDDYMRRMYTPLASLDDPDAPPPGWSEGVEGVTV